MDLGFDGLIHFSDAAVVLPCVPYFVVPPLAVLAVVFHHVEDIVGVFVAEPKHDVILAALPVEGVAAWQKFVGEFLACGFVVWHGLTWSLV